MQRTSKTMSVVSSSLRYLFSFSLSPHFSKPKNLFIPRIVSSKKPDFPRSRSHISANVRPFCSISRSNNVAETIDTSIDRKYLSCCMPDKKPLKIAVLLSGGVDSSVALRLLHLAGHSCTAFYLKIWFQVCFFSLVRRLLFLVILYVLSYFACLLSYWVHIAYSHSTKLNFLKACLRMIPGWSSLMINWELLKFPARNGWKWKG